MKYVFAGDREISVRILKFVISSGYKPSLLWIPDRDKSSHGQELIAISGLPEDKIFVGNDFKTGEGIDILRNIRPDYIFGIHFPYIIPESILEVPGVGMLNLHPAYLPYNRGWHTPSWAIIEKTPYGATLHFMTKELDRGDIIHQQLIEILPEDTADTLYKKVLKLEYDVFAGAWEDIINMNPKSISQTGLAGTSHVKKDLAKIQEINLDGSYKGREFIDLLRALTTNRMEEAAFFVKDGEKYGIQVRIEKIGHV